MQFKETKLKGCFLITPQVFEDKRGYFFESFNQQLFEKAIGYHVDFVQDNQSQSSYGVLRGLHLQLGKNAQAKLVRAIQGRLLDIAVDLRTGSITYGQWVAYELSEQNKQQLFIPRGFAHGFVVLSKMASIHYKADNYYAPQAESGIIYNDESLNIGWQVPTKDIITSDKDLKLPTLQAFTEKHG